MSIFEYISVLSSIIIGLGITQLLRGVVQIIHHPEDGKPYLIHRDWTETPEKLFTLGCFNVFAVDYLVVVPI